MGMLSLSAVGDSAGVAALMFNSGAMPRLGPHRINVKIARFLATRGVPSLRFDLAGQGDSRSWAIGHDYQHQATADIAAAMDFVEGELGVSRFMLIGICSGAVHAFRAAEADPRVCGLLMYDGYWNRTIWTMPVRHWKRFRSLGLAQTARLLARRLARRTGSLTDPGQQSGASIYGSGWPGQPTKADFAESMQEVVSRGVAVRLLYSGFMIQEGWYSYAAQFRHAFAGYPFADMVRVDLKPDFDHTPGSLSSQRELIAIVDEWISSRANRSQADK
jgi:pimeloyl-ACP methyl ester carboxylesterase